MVNLETAITTRGTPQSKEFTFRAPPSALTALQGAGIDVATMANNHGLDYGEVGLHDSLLAIHSSGYPVVGIGSDAAAAYARLPAGHPQGYQDAFTAFVADVYATVAGRKPDGLPTFADGLRAAVLTQAVMTAAAEQSWVEVPA